jgi:hypothetical protein
LADEYRFLRFESVGITTIIFLICGFLPLIPDSVFNSIKLDLSSTAAIIGAIFLLSLPLGYLSHQFVVNKYRSENKPRIIHKFLEKRIKDIDNNFFSNWLPIEKISFLTSLLDLSIYNSKNNTDKEIHDRISSLWSHFYARKAVGKYSPTIGIIIQGILIFSSVILGINLALGINRLIISALIWAFIFIVGIFLIDPYSKKIWNELNYLEIELILYEYNQVYGILTNIITEISADKTILKMSE